LTLEELGLVDSLAGHEGKSRSDVLREALMTYAA
jgi:hypothetical protein